MSCLSFMQKLSRKKYISDDKLSTSNLKRCLNVFDLTALGVGSTLGLGIYVLAGQVAKDDAGPSVVLAFFIAAVASAIAGICYAEFGSRVPRAGSAYVYSYVTVGEFIGYIIGWNLILEYVIGAASVARGYSGYFDSLVGNSMSKAFRSAMPLNANGIADYPDFFAFGMTLALAVILSIGVKESSKVNNVFTVINLTVVLYVIICGAFKCDIYNWEIPKSDIPAAYDGGEGGFFPFGVSGLMAGAATCFYGFVGFDAIATTGEEAKNPQKSIPIAIIISLFIIFAAYCGVAIVLTMMLPYYLQDEEAPIPYAFEMVGYPVAEWVVLIGALFGLSTSLLGAMFPLPRILYAMSTDGLIFRFLSRISPRFKTPLIATMIAGVFAALMALFFDLDALVDMMSIGTLLAYTLVAASVLILRYRPDEIKESIENNIESRRTSNVDHQMQEESFYQNEEITKQNSEENKQEIDVRIHEQIDVQIENQTDVKVNSTIGVTIRKSITQREEPLTETSLLRQLLNLDRRNEPTILSSSIVTWVTLILGIFLTGFNALLIYAMDAMKDDEVWAIVLTAIVGVLCVCFVIIIGVQPKNKKKVAFMVPWVPVIPALSIWVNTQLMLKLSIATWVRFAVWMAIGLAIYFLYGVWESSEEYIRKGKTPPNLNEDVFKLIEEEKQKKLLKKLKKEIHNNLQNEAAEANQEIDSTSSNSEISNETASISYSPTSYR